MVLAIDIGNTHIVVGCFQKDRIVFVERISTNRTNTTLEYAVSFKTILEIYQIPVSEIEGNIIASVVPSVTTTVKRAVETITKQETLLVGPGIKTGLHITIDNPAQLGSNLVVTAVAALHTYQAPIAVIDMGTATTISVINKQEEYVGGMILPGVGISLAALTEKTSLLQTIDLEKPKKMIATNTVDCMRSGVLYGTAYGLDGILQQIEQEMQQPVTAVATGGLAEVIIPYCRYPITLDSTLLLNGMRIIYQKNRTQKS